LNNWHKRFIEWMNTPESPGIYKMVPDTLLSEEKADELRKYISDPVGLFHKVNEDRTTEDWVAFYE
jgi:hypothetical protein